MFVFRGGKSIAITTNDNVVKNEANYIVETTNYRLVSLVVFFRTINSHTINNIYIFTTGHEKEPEEFLKLKADVKVSNYRFEGRAFIN